MSEIKTLTDDKGFLIKELQKEFVELPDEIKPTKYDQGTGTYYTDEELARQKLQPIEVPSKEEKPKDDNSTLEDLLKLFVDRSTVQEEKVIKKGYSFNQDKDAKWHS